MIKFNIHDCKRIIQVLGRLILVRRTNYNKNLIQTLIHAPSSTDLDSWILHRPLKTKRKSTLVLCCPKRFPVVLGPCQLICPWEECTSIDQRHNGRSMLRGSNMSVRVWDPKALLEWSTNLPWAHWNGKAVSESCFTSLAHWVTESESLNMIAPKGNQIVRLWIWNVTGIHTSTCLGIYQVE